MEISVVAESIPHLRRGALKDFLSMMKSGFRYVDKRFNKSLLRYDFDNGSYIEFFSADDSSKLRGARRDILYINECNNIEFEAYNELRITSYNVCYTKLLRILFNFPYYPLVKGFIVLIR